MARASGRSSSTRVSSKGRRAGRTERTGPAQKRAIRAEMRERREQKKWDEERTRAELARYAKAAEALKRGDDWQNVITGLGVFTKDWRMATTLETDDILTRQQLDDLYTQDNLAARVVDALPDDAIRRWVRIVGGNGADAGEFQAEIQAHFTRLHVKQKFLQWMKLGRKDGGAIMLIGADDGQELSNPLEPRRVREIRHVHVLERWAVIPDVIDLDPLSQNFGEPLYYLMLPRAIQSSTFVAPSPRILREQNTLDGLRLHFSRVFPHEGIQISERRKIAQRGWGYSALQRCWQPIMNYRLLWGHITTLFKHVAQTVVKFAGYGELLGADFSNAIQARLAQVQIARSTLNVVPLDKEDEFEEQTLRGISGALEIFKYAQEDLAQATGQPLTKLFGHKPQGFSTDDDAGMRNWYDQVRAAQEDFLLQPLTMLVEIIAEAYNITTPDDWHVEFVPLEEPDDKTKATCALQRAQRDQIYVQEGIVTADEVRETLRADPTVEYILEDGEVPMPNHQPVPLPADVPPDAPIDSPIDTQAPKPSPGDPSQHVTVERGPKGAKVTFGGNLP